MWGEAKLVYNRAWRSNYFPYAIIVSAEGGMRINAREMFKNYATGEKVVEREVICPCAGTNLLLPAK
jgi:hypothetical protein